MGLLGRSPGYSRALPRVRSVSGSDVPDAVQSIDERHADILSRAKDCHCEAPLRRACWLSGASQGALSGSIQSKQGRMGELDDVSAIPGSPPDPAGAVADRHRAFIRMGVALSF
jgi:hypothetical protein